MSGGSTKGPGDHRRPGAAGRRSARRVGQRGAAGFQGRLTNPTAPAPRFGADVDSPGAGCSARVAQRGRTGSGGATARQGLDDRADHLVGLRGLGDVGVKKMAVLLGQSEGAHGDQPGVAFRRAGPQPSCKLVAIRAGHLDVHQGHLESLRIELLQGLVGARRFHTLGSLGAQQICNGAANGVFIVDDEDVQARQARRASQRPRRLLVQHLHRDVHGGPGAVALLRLDLRGPAELGNQGPNDR